MKIVFEGTRSDIVAQIRDLFPEVSGPVTVLEAAYITTEQQAAVDNQVIQTAAPNDPPTEEKPKRTRRTKTEQEVPSPLTENEDKKVPDDTKREAEAELLSLQEERGALRAQVIEMRNTVGGDTAKRIMDLAHCADLEAASLETLQKLHEDFTAVLAARAKPVAEAEDAPAIDRATVIKALTQLKADKGDEVAHGILPSLGLGKLNTVDAAEYPHILAAIAEAAKDDGF